VELVVIICGVEGAYSAGLLRYASNDKSGHHEGRRPMAACPAEAADDLKSAGYPQEHADSGTLPPSEAGGNFSENGHEGGVWMRGLYNFRDVVSSSL